MANVKASEQAAVLGSIDPDAYGTGTYTTGWIDASEFDRFMAIVQTGTLGTSATIDAKLEEATDSSGTGAQDISGKSITQLTQGSPDGSDQQALIDLKQTELDLADDYTHFRLSITVGTATSDAGGLVLGFHPNYHPAFDHDASSVAEIV
jgi:hypothetical protein